MEKVNHKIYGWIEVFPHTKKMLIENGFIVEETKEKKQPVKTKEEKKVRKTKTK